MTSRTGKYGVRRWLPLAICAVSLLGVAGHLWHGFTALQTRINAQNDAIGRLYSANEELKRKINFLEAATYGDTYIKSHVQYVPFRQPPRPLAHNQVAVKGWTDWDPDNWTKGTAFEYWTQTDANGVFQVRIPPGVYAMIMIETERRSVQHANITVAKDQTVTLPPITWSSGR